MLLSALSLAFATPVLPIQGTLTGAGGAPLQGAEPVTFRLYDDPGSATPAWEATLAVAFVDGTFAALLPISGAPSGLFADEDLAVTVVHGAVESARAPVGFAPRAWYAREAGVAGEAARATIADALDPSAVGEGLTTSGGAVAVDTTWLDALLQSFGETLAFEGLSLGSSSGLTGDGTPASPVSLSSTGVAAGSYTAANLTIDEHGRVVYAEDGQGFTGVTLDPAAGLAGDGTGGAPLGLSATGVAPGAYTAPNLSVDAYGRITAVTNGSPTTLPVDCSEIKARNPTAASGNYLIAPGNVAPFRVWCDMVTDGGGWTLTAHMMKSSAENGQWSWTSPLWTSAPDPTDTTALASDQVFDVYRVPDTKSRAWGAVAGDQILITRGEDRLATITASFASTAAVVAGGGSCTAVHHIAPNTYVPNSGWTDHGAVCRFKNSRGTNYGGNESWMLNLQVSNTSTSGPDVGGLHYNSTRTFGYDKCSSCEKRGVNDWNGTDGVSYRWYVRRPSALGPLCTGTPGSQTCPARSCKQLKYQLESATNGDYWLDPDGGAFTNAFRVRCNMTDQGGGWTLVANIREKGGTGGAFAWGDARWNDVGDAGNVARGSTTLYDVFNTADTKSWAWNDLVGDQLLITRAGAPLVTVHSLSRRTVPVALASGESCAATHHIAPAGYVPNPSWTDHGALCRFKRTRGNNYGGNESWMLNFQISNTSPSGPDVGGLHYNSTRAFGYDKCTSCEKAPVQDWNGATGATYLWWVR